MSPRPSTPRSSRSSRGATGGRSRGRSTNPREEPPYKKRKYVPGGPGGGGRFVPVGEGETVAEGPAPAASSRPRASARAASSTSATLLPRRERSARTRTATNRRDPGDMEFSSSAALAAAVVSNEGYKPREERGWEEFHPNLDIEATFMVFHSEVVDGTAKATPPPQARQSQDNLLAGASTPSRGANASLAGAVGESSTQGATPAVDSASADLDTPLRRRMARPARDAISFYASRSDFLGTPKTPKVLPIHNQTPKERLDLKLPSYRKTDRIMLFESKQARYVEKAMMNVGYQESDNFIRPERELLKATDFNADEDLDQPSGSKADGELAVIQPPTNNSLGRVEYDMDEQDDKWLQALNVQRKAHDLEDITREIFEITITKIEKEWHALEKRIPKPNPKPPQTHRPRSSSAAAVNGEPQAGEEQDSKCAICDDGDCENTNAIVFCDGCDLAVHQECYGVPFIPEGQWMCRKCQLAGRGIPTCIFCPNTEGAFKQTNSSKWAHLLCAMWVPEVTLGNHTFMEPVMDVEKVPRSRWKLHCYICEQRMGACIQCSRQQCYQAFHVTCARRANLYLKMKNSQGQLAVLDGSEAFAFCNEHSPGNYGEEHGVAAATAAAKKFYKRTMKGRIWADNQASAQRMAATHIHALTEHPPDESQMIGAKLSGAADKKKGPTGKVWKLPSGAPVIPQAVFELVDNGLQRFPFRKRKEFVGEACRYWTLKREARRGAALLKRLQLQMETFSSMELTRRDFAAMGPSGKARLSRRIDFAGTLMKDLQQLNFLSEDIVKRELAKLDQVVMEQDFVDTSYFPVFKLLLPVIEKAQLLDKNVFSEGLSKLQSNLDARFYTTTLAFAHDLCEIIHVGINVETKSAGPAQSGFEPIDASPTKHSTYSDVKDRKRLGKRIIKSVQPQLETALRAEASIISKPVDNLQKELEGMIDASLEMQHPFAPMPQRDHVAESGQDVIMVDAADEAQITVAEEVDVDAEHEVDPEAADNMDVDEPAIEVNTSGVAEETGESNGMLSSSTMNIEHDAQAAARSPEKPLVNGLKSAPTPPDMNGYVTVTDAPLQAPLTPPQSNGSLGRGPENPLTQGGVPWYMKSFELDGTTAVEEQWAGREAVRSLSEELTDMDEAELNDLEFNVEDSTITASPTVDAAPAPSMSRKKGAAKITKRLRSSNRRR